MLGALGHGLNGLGLGPAWEHQNCMSWVGMVFMLSTMMMTQGKSLTCWLIKTGFLISGYIPTTLFASCAIDMYSSKVIIGNFPKEQMDWYARNYI